MSPTEVVQQCKAAIRSTILQRPGPRRSLAMKGGQLVVAGMFTTGNGLGRAAQGCYQALVAEGFDPVAADLSGLFGQSDLEASVPPGKFDPAKGGTLILYANPPEVERALMGLGIRRWHDWHVIGAWAWELPVAPASWQRQTRFVSEIWAPSRFVAESFEARFERPVRVVPHYIEPASPEVPPPLRTADVPRILVMADARSSLARKNPISAIRMFQAAFPRRHEAELVVKCRNLSDDPRQARELAGLADGDQRITLMNETLSSAEHARLIRDCDILLSPHRSEGFGLNLAEAMAHGKAVIATGWSGNLDFMTSESVALLGYDLVPVRDPSGIYPEMAHTRWAEPDFEAGVEALRTLAGDDAGRRRLAETARKVIATTLGSGAYRRALLASDNQDGKVCRLD